MTTCHSLTITMATVLHSQSKSRMSLYLSVKEVRKKKGSIREAGSARSRYMYTLLKSDVTRRDHVSVVMDPMNAGSRNSQFHSQFHLRRHSLRITLKCTTLVCMRSSNA